MLFPLLFCVRRSRSNAVIVRVKFSHGVVVPNKVIFPNSDLKIACYKYLWGDMFTYYNNITHKPYSIGIRNMPTTISVKLKYMVGFWAVGILVIIHRKNVYIFKRSLLKELHLSNIFLGFFFCIFKSWLSFCCMIFKTQWTGDSTTINHL